MKTIIFRDELNPETVTALIDEIEQSGCDSPETDIRVLFSSPGGQADMTQAIVDCVNELPEDWNVEFVFTHQVHSASFRIFVDLQCKKRLYDSAHALVHLYSRSIDALEYTKKKGSYDSFLMNKLEDANNRFYKWLKGLDLFTKKELNKIWKGGDVFVDYDRLQKIIDDQNGGKRRK